MEKCYKRRVFSICIGLIVLVSWFQVSGQTAIKDVVPNHFNQYYRIITHTGKSLDKSITSSGNSNVYEHNYQGLHNQQWLIMPLHLTSPEAIIVNRHGKVLDRHHRGNIYCHDFHGGSNQIFRFDRKSDGKVIIVSDNMTVGDISSSGLKRDPFSSPNLHGGNLYAGNRHEGNNQKFSFLAAGAIANSGNLASWRLFNNPIDINITSPPAPASLNDNTLTGTTTPMVQIGQTYIPCIHVADPGKDFNWKINNSPYYIVKQFTYYELFESYVASASIGVSNTWGVKYGISQSVANQVSYTLGMTHKSDGGVTDVFNSSVSQTFTAGLVVTQTTTQSYEETKTTTITNNAGVAARVWMWRRMVKYELWRMNESYPFFAWTLRTNQNAFLAYPHNLDIVVVSSKSTENNIDYYQIVVSGQKMDPKNNEEGFTNNLDNHSIIDGENSISIQELKSTSEQPLNLSFEVFPNPAKTSFSILMAESLDARFRLIDINGRILRDIKSNHSNVEIDCSDIANGIYSLQIVVGGKYYVRKIVIQR